MISARPKAAFRARREACFAEPEFSEGLYITCALTYPDRKQAPADLSDEIAARFGYAWRSYRVITDGVDFLFSKYHGETDFRLVDIYTYTNQQNWRRQPIAAPPDDAPPVYFEFAVEEEKDDTLDVDCSIEFVCDEAARRIAFAFDEPALPGKTYRIADRLYAVRDDDLGLLRLVFRDVASKDTETDGSG